MRWYAVTLACNLRPGVSWRVVRRYSEFVALLWALRTSAPDDDVPPIPPKLSPLASASDRLRRVLGLQCFCEKTLGCDELLVQRATSKFFELDSGLWQMPSRVSPPQARARLCVSRTTPDLGMHRRMHTYTHLHAQVDRALRAAACALQANVRGWRQRECEFRMRRAAERIQAAWQSSRLWRVSELNALLVAAAAASATSGGDKRTPLAERQESQGSAPVGRKLKTKSKPFWQLRAESELASRAAPRISGTTCTGRKHRPALWAELGSGVAS